MSEPLPEAPGDAMLALMRELHPLCRSITGDGVRETLRILRRLVPLEVHEVPSGTSVLDWTVPPEWNVRDAWIADARGRRVVDFRASNLHLVGYSVPLRRRVPLAELRQHLHTLPDRPDWIPYRTSYYHETWGFCVTRKQLEALCEPEYEVCIDATLAPGHLSYGECLLPGTLEEEILVCAHVCHPSLADDNLSGIAVAAFLARRLAQRPRRRSWRFLWAPGTIGSITWLARNRERLGRLRGGVTLVCLGDAEKLTYKRSFHGGAEVDRAFARALSESGREHAVIDFHPYGYDERQFNSPGFRIPVGSLMRGRHGRFPEYHTSADDLDFVSGAQLADALALCEAAAGILDANRRFRSLAPEGEPQLGRRGLYRALGGEADPEALQYAMLWVLSLADARHDLLDTAERSGLPFATVQRAAELLERQRLLEALAEDAA